MAHLAAREVDHVVHQRRHALAAALDQPGQDGEPLFVAQAEQHQLGAGDDGAQRVAQVVSQHGDELLAQFGRGARVEQGNLGLLEHLLRTEMLRDQFGKQGHRRQRRRGRQVARQGVEAAQGAEVLAVVAQDRHRDEALETIHGGRRMALVDQVVADGVDHDRHAAGAHRAAQGGLDG
jgi:hypothetical protein